MAGRPLPPRERELLDAADFIRRSFHRRPTLSEIARAARLSPFHLHRLFKQRFGESPFRMVARLQMEHAQELLLRGLPAAEVATRLGFNDASHFGARFRRETGTTPTRWLRQKLGGKPPR